LTPPVAYAQSGDIHIAYQVVGDGDLDLVAVAGTLTNLSVLWEEPRVPSLLRTARIVCPG